MTPLHWLLVADFALGLCAGLSIGGLVLWHHRTPSPYIDSAKIEAVRPARRVWSQDRD